ncbi:MULTISPECIES: hypothetical protein [Niastella]|uniref:Lipoprotein n=1 Tax=Niastella soli TaxID=2821487 RepID=A0ABS3YVA3_9BACT|nr:hypothetical protein [Niastella soli]MBO9201857.1 hypothetical protein [Niastella soli]
MKMNVLYAIGAMAILVACSAPYQAQKSVWTVKEVQESYNKDSAKKYNTNCVLYRGTDNQAHYFLTQFTDKWVFLTIKKTELSITEEKPYKVDSAVKLGYYYVDPNNHFVKTRDFN